MKKSQETLVAEFIGATKQCAETAKTSFQAADVSTAEAVARAASIVSLITGFVQADQPHGSADLYPSHWN